MPKHVHSFKPIANATLLDGLPCTAEVCTTCHQVRLTAIPGQVHFKP